MCVGNSLANMQYYMLMCTISLHTNDITERVLFLQPKFPPVVTLIIIELEPSLYKEIFSDLSYSDQINGFGLYLATISSSIALTNSLIVFFSWYTLLVSHIDMKLYTSC